MGRFGGYRLAKILVVEDNALNIKLFCDLLTAHGHETEPVLDSREAMDAARAFHHGHRADGAASRRR
jgi:two-component system cell cycle response regulator DivK